jgi:hypothetical protein
MNTYDLAVKKVNLKKVSSTHGGEWHGPCPGCGDGGRPKESDRFHIWPNQNDGKGSYWCRSCLKAGDNIQFLIDFEGMNFKDACAYLDITMADRPTDFTPPPEKREFEPTQYKNPTDLWQERAQKFITWAQGNLKENKSALSWLASRGISAEAAEQARLGWNPGEDGKDIFRHHTAWGLPDQKKENGKSRKLWIPRGLVIPLLCVIPAQAGIQEQKQIIIRIKIRRPEEHRTEEYPDPYIFIWGSSKATMVIGAERKAFILVESELDAIACAASTDLAGTVALGTLEGKPDAAAYAILKGAVQILNALDYGDVGGGKTAAQRAIKWWAEQFPDNCDRWPVPRGKDPGEAYQMGIDLGQWIRAGLPPVLTISAVIPAQAGIRNIQSPPEGTPPLLAELWKLLRDNPGVKIINEPGRFTLLRNGKYGGAGRINHLVFHEKEVREYILNHPDQEITWKNLIKVISPIGEKKVK